jgi:hypothetical protein
MEIALRLFIGHQVVVMGPGFVENEKLRSVKLLTVEEPASGSRARKLSTK